MPKNFITTGSYKAVIHFQSVSIDQKIVEAHDMPKICYFGRKFRVSISSFDFEFWKLPGAGEDRAGARASAKKLSLPDTSDRHPVTIYT